MRSGVRDFSVFEYRPSCKPQVGLSLNEESLFFIFFWWYFTPVEQVWYKIYAGRLIKYGK